MVEDWDIETVMAVARSGGMRIAEWQPDNLPTRVYQELDRFAAPIHIYWSAVTQAIGDTPELDEEHRRIVNQALKAAYCLGLEEREADK